MADLPGASMVAVSAITTIYLANTDQIANPDFIEPGQIFMVPEEPLANAEELHRDRVRKRRR